MGFSQVLRARGEAGLVVLLRLRPDLASPPPSGVRGLAARATSRAALERTLAAVDAEVLQVAEAVTALAGTSVPGPPSPARVAAAVGTDLDGVRRALGVALDLALVVPTEPLSWWPDPDASAATADLTDDALRLEPCPGIDEVLGPYPAGLGPALARTLDRRDREALTALESATRGDDGELPPDPGALATRLAEPAVVMRLLETAPPGSRQVLDALAWGPPVGRTPARGPAGRRPGTAADGADSPARTAVDWLLRHGLLAVSDAQHVVLPREVALALRDGRTHRATATAPDPGATSVPEATVDAESVAHAEETVRLVALLLDTWGAEPAPLLRAGGLGVRELRKVAARLDVPEPDAALLVEVAAVAGLVAPDGEEQPTVLPTTDADDWLDDDLGERWAHLARAWLASDRAAWLVGTRDERGTARAALDAEALRRPWAPRLRSAALDVLAGAPGALDPTTVHAVLTWRTPRAAPAPHAVEAVLREATVLGVVGAGALGGPGRALLTGPDDGAPGPGAAGAPADVLTSRLPPAVDDVLLQGDLTGIVPGRPSAALGELIDAAAEVESRGAALTVRFTASSVQRALDRGRTAEELLAHLSRHAPTGVPQPLEYLVLDTARRHGQVRTGVASAYLRSDDPALLAGLAEDPALRGLGLLRVAPTVLVAQAPPSALVTALRDRGVPVVAEDDSGRVLAVDPTRQRIRLGRRRSSAPTPPAPDPAGARERRLQRVARDLLARSRDGTDDDAPSSPDPADRSGTTAPGDEGTPDPLAALALLREAAAEGREVWLELVDPAGAPVRRRVRPIRVDAGRVRVIDTAREAELTVAVHRITDVSPA